MTPAADDHDLGPRGKLRLSHRRHLAPAAVEVRAAERRLGLVEALRRPSRGSRSRSGWCAAWMKPQSDQPYSLHSACSRTRARSARGRRAEVRLGPGLGLLGGEAALGGGVAELEAGVVVAGVLVVDQPRRSSPSSMKLAASRSLLHGTVGRACGGERAAYRAPGVRVVVVGRRQPEAALPHGREVRRLPGEHVEVAGEPGAGVQPAAGVGRPGQHARVVEGRSSSVRARQEPDDQHPEVGPVLEDLGAHAGLGRGRGVDVLGVPVDAEQPGVALASSAPPGRAASPSSVVVTRTLWLVSPPGRSTTRQDRPARMARRSRFATDGRSALSRRTPR